MEDFETWWKQYPKKVAKGDARRAWTQTAKIRPALQELMKALYAARASKQWLKDSGDYIPYPATYLRGERWSDEYEVDLSKLNSSTGKVCGYCGKPSVGSANGIHHCREHADSALAGERTKVVNLNSNVVDKKLQSCGS